MTWLYLLKERSEVSDVIELFHNEINTQFLTSIRVFRTNNVLKYMKNGVSLFCSKNEIIHQTSCSHMSQQNGIVERKYTHPRCCSNHDDSYACFEVSVADAVLSACHLINRMPSVLLGR